MMLMRKELIPGLLISLAFPAASEVLTAQIKPPGYADLHSTLQRTISNLTKAAHMGNKHL